MKRLIFSFYIFFIGMIVSGQVVSTITDSRDDQVYDVVTIGDQTWMAENLNYYTSRYSTYWNNDSIEYSRYGRLYPRFIADTICPSGYHLSTDDDWAVLEAYLGMSSGDVDRVGYRSSGDVAKLLKSSYLEGEWGYGDRGALDSYSFAALPGGYIRGSSFYGLYNVACFWTATQSHDDPYDIRVLSVGKDGVDKQLRSESLYMSVRGVLNTGD
jgi:uncharacterized protein (TIGR02145 family)